MRTIHAAASNVHLGGSAVSGRFQGRCTAITLNPIVAFFICSSPAMLRSYGQVESMNGLSCTVILSAGFRPRHMSETQSVVCLILGPVFVLWKEEAPEGSECKLFARGLQSIGLLLQQCPASFAVAPKAGFEPARVSPPPPQAALPLIWHNNPFTYRIITTSPA